MAIYGLGSGCLGRLDVVFQRLADERGTGSGVEHEKFGLLNELFVIRLLDIGT